MTTDASQREIHWQKTRKLMFFHLAIWFIFSFLVHWFAVSLNEITFNGFPFGFYMAAQGSLAVFVVQLFFFIRQQDKIDRDCGMAEEG